MDNHIMNYTEHRTAPMPKLPWIMYQKWEDILTLHVPINIAELAPHIPDKRTLDSYDGKGMDFYIPVSREAFEI